MNATLLLDRDARRLLRSDGRAFDPALCAWTERLPDEPRPAESIGAVDAMRWLARDARCGWRVPVGVIGPRDIDPVRYALAEGLGAALAGLRLPVLCGGRGGVMEAVCKGVASAGGVAIGLLPEGDPALANAYAGIVIATGIGEARNALIARAAACLVAIGDSYGTLSEVALGRQFGKRVIGLAGAADVVGVEHVDDVETAVQRVAEAMLGVCGPPSRIDDAKRGGAP